MTMASDHLEPRESKELPLFDVGPESGSEGVIHPTASTPGGAATQGMPPGSRWPDLPAPIMAEPVPQAPYPEDYLPADLEEVLRAVQRTAQCPAATAGAALLGALALLAQEDYRVETLAPDPSPPSLYLVALSESGLPQDHRLQAACAGPPGGGHPARSSMERGPGTIPPARS